VKEIPGDNDYIGPSSDDTIDRGSKRLGHISFTLVYAVRVLPVVLPDTEVRVGDMSQFHGWRMGPNARKSKKLSDVSTVLGRSGYGGEMEAS
jgi:hypothetical protein